MGFRKNLRTLYGLIADSEIIRREIKRLVLDQSRIKECLKTSREFECSKIKRDLETMQGFIEKTSGPGYFNAQYPKDAAKLVAEVREQMKLLVPELAKYDVGPWARDISELARNKNKLKKLHQQLAEKKVQIKELKALMFKKRT